MRRIKMGFWHKLILYILPFAIAFMALTASMIFVGESMPLAWVVERQQNSDELVLFRYRYGNRDQQYKLLAVNERQPEVLAIGSSRVLQFRDGFFNRNPDAFYNASGPAWRLEQVFNLLLGIDQNQLPKIIILGIDPPWFNDAYVGDVFPEPVSDFGNLFTVNRSFIQDVLDGEEFDTNLYFDRIEPGSGGNLALGMRAIRDGHGFRNDGSEQFGDYLVAHWLWQPQQRDNHLNLMLNGEDMYVYGDTVSTAKMQMMRDLLTFAQINNILVIGFLPSYTPTLWNQMLQTGNHTYVPQVTTQLETLFAEYNQPFFDYSNGAVLPGVTDEDFFDGWHLSERGNLALYIDMLAHLPNELGPYSDPAMLQNILNAAANTWSVFDLLAS